MLSVYTCRSDSLGQVLYQLDSDTERQIFVRVGQRQVIEFLREQCRQQQEESNVLLEGNVLGR